MALEFLDRGRERERKREGIGIGEGQMLLALGESGNKQLMEENDEGGCIMDLILGGWLASFAW